MNSNSIFDCLLTWINLSSIFQINYIDFFRLLSEVIKDPRYWISSNRNNFSISTFSYRIIFFFDVFSFDVFPFRPFPFRRFPFLYFFRRFSLSTFSTKIKKKDIEFFTRQNCATTFFHHSLWAHFNFKFTSWHTIRKQKLCSTR